VHGLVVGAVVQVASFVGLWAGFALGAVLAPSVARLSGSPFTKILLTIATLVIVTSLVAGLARVAGVRVWAGLQRSPLGRVDSAFGIVVGAVATLLLVWLLAGMLARIPEPGLTDQIQHSAILRALDNHLPAQPQVFARIGRLFSPLGFPDVFAQFEPNAAPSLPLPADPVVRAAVAAAGQSTVKIEGIGCGSLLEGSGFVVASDLVVTNAHVVAGVARPVVVDKAGTHRATAVLFDPKMDVAVLRASGVREPPLRLLTGTAGRGTEGAALGYPGGGPFRAVPAVVLSEVSALGRDIYGKSLTARDVYQLRSAIRPGNSGGPLVRPDGTVVGVVFARSSLNPSLGFALTSAEVRTRVATAEARPVPTSTGPCAAD
jgi:S1-C subfamily serine protease